MSSQSGLGDITSPPTAHVGGSNITDGPTHRSDRGFSDASNFSEDSDCIKLRDSVASGQGYITSTEVFVTHIEPASPSDIESGHVDDKEQSKLGWKKQSLLLAVAGIAIGTFAMVYAFAKLGMRDGLLVNPCVGLCSWWTAKIIGKVKLNNPEVGHYPAAVGLVSKAWEKFTGWMFTAFLIFLVGSHVVAGKAALYQLLGTGSECAISWSSIAAFVLFLIALPKRLDKFVFLAYIDCASLLITVFTVLVYAGVTSGDLPAAEAWSWDSPKDSTTVDKLVAGLAIFFAQGFQMILFSMMSDMHTPKDYVKSISWLCAIEVVFFSTVGATGYYFLGSRAQNLVLILKDPLWTKVAFGMALPVLFISGSINNLVLGKFFLEKAQRYPKLCKLQQKHP